MPNFYPRVIFIVIFYFLGECHLLNGGTGCLWINSSCRSEAPGLKKFGWTPWKLKFLMCYKVAIFGAQELNCSSFGIINLFTLFGNYH